jgi:hypothetical protein
MSEIGCSVCGYLSCVCNVLKRHEIGCKFRFSVTCPVAIECEHGYDVCPICDPCTCGVGVEISDFGKRNVGKSS